MSSVEYCLERTRELLRHALDQTQSPVAGPIIYSYLSLLINHCETWLSKSQSTQKWQIVAVNDRVIQGFMRNLSATLTEPFEQVWRLDLAQGPPNAVIGDKKNNDEHKLVEQAEYFIASRVFDYLRRVYPQMQNLVGFAMAGILAQVLACSAYPFPASNTLLTLAWIALLVGAGVSVYVFVQMNRNSIISLLQGTSPDHLSFTGSFAFQLLFVGFLPILTMLGAQFPHSFGAIFSWAGGIFSHSSGS
jgi:hypothetical protein